MPLPTCGTSTLGSGQLARALRDEHTVLEDLLATIERQRRAVARDDIDAVNDSVFAAHRLLSAYREARSRRRRAVILACGGGDGSVEDLSRSRGARVTEIERTASEALRDAARRLVDAVGVNRRLLQAAMSSGDTFLHLLTATAGPRLVDPRG